MFASRRAPLAVMSALALLTGCQRRSASLASPIESPPAPAAVSTPPVVGCGLPAATGTGEDCPMESPKFQDSVERAIDQAVVEHPEMVNTKLLRGCGNCFQVLDTHNFPEEVGRDLQKMGFCTKYDGEELAVKKVNDFNEQYDILLSEGYLRREAIGSYRATCRPAWF